MADIELVIKIPKKEFGVDITDKFQDFFNRLKAEIKEHLITNTSLVCGAYELETIDMFLKAFNNGIQLPNGHGRLVDADEIQFENAEFDTYGDYSRAFDAIDGAETIIETDKAESEG